jgi:hypothetical protein
MPIAPIRVACKKQLVQLLRAAPALADWQVVYSWATHGPDRDHIRVGLAPTSGESNVPTMKAGRKYRDDRFGISLYVLASAPDRSFEEAEERVEEALASIDSVLADDPHLGGLLTGGLGATLGKVDGPDSDGTEQGALGYGRCVVNVHSRLT